MRFILHSQITDVSVRSSLGFPEYSYHFVMKGFRPAFERLGQVDVVVDAQREVDVIYRSAVAAGEDCLFVSFAPPHRTLTSLECPVLPVIAWEFTTIPDEVWDDEPRNDWRSVLARTGRAITLSTQTAEVIREAMGPDYRVRCVPVPMPGASAPAARDAVACELNPKRAFIDSWALGLPADPATDGGARRPQGNAQAPIPALLGRASKVFRSRKRKEPLTYPLRSLGAYSPPVVYTSVFNPSDGRKNWRDIVTAFCFAFRQQSDAMLVLKTVSMDIVRFKGELLNELLRLSPMRCRVVVLDGFLDDEDYQALVGITTYNVNASTGEGMCLPLMEFMAAGKPAIAPAHTAMADYIDDSVAFVVASSLEHNVWPHDPRDLFRTMRHRINWASLLDAFQRSYDVATEDGGRYRSMSEAAGARIDQYCSVEDVAAKLRSFLTEPSHAILPVASGEPIPA